MYIFVIVLLPSVGLSCTFDAPLGFEKWRYISASKPIQMANSCGFVNGGIADDVSGGTAIPLGEGRFYQEIENGFFNKTISTAMLVDCNHKQMTLIGAVYLPSSEDEVHDACFGQISGELSEFLPPNGPLTLKEGRDLYEFEEIARSTGKIAVDPRAVRLVGNDIYGIQFSSKDRVDFLCGCRQLYPNSPGAKK
ncbi:MAG: hypothetical protein AAF408_02025 [Pseudomonadota bacterium]